MHVWNWVGLSLCTLTLGGCTMPQQMTKGVSGLTASSSSNFRTVQNLKRTSPAQITPVESGKGLVVFEPVVSGNAAKLSAFGAGCGRWLHLNVAGQGELGKTPMWGEVDDARRSLHKPSLQFAVSDAQATGKRLGLTHVAVGTLTARGAQSILTYRIYDVANGQAQGSPIEAKGSLDGIAQSLPKMAQQMATQLQIHSPSLPQRTELSAAELATVGQMPWKLQQQPLRGPLAKELNVLATRSPLAGLLVMRDIELSDQQVTQIVKQQLQLAPLNTLVLADICREHAAATSSYRATYQRVEQKFPNNYVLSLAHAFWCNMSGDYQGYIQGTEHAVSCSPHNSDSWYQLSSALSDLADYVRQSRYSNQIVGAEQTFLDGVYADALDSAERATRTAPGDSWMWSHLASTATFAGDEEKADTSLWKALQLDPNNVDAYDWGFEMYQPKWFDDPQKMLQLAKMAASHSNKYVLPVDHMVGALYASNLQDQKAPILAQCVKLNPQNPQALYNWGAVLHYDQKHYRKAEEFYKQAIALDPEYGRPVGSLGDLTYWVKHDTQRAEQYYAQAIVLEPNLASHYEDMARFLAQTGRRQQAMTVIQKARNLGANDDHPVWAELGIKP